jgi:hypothetical protein
MANKLEDIFRSYTNIVQLKLQKEARKPGLKEPLTLFTDKTMELRTLVDELENEAEFHQLVAETRSAFLGGYHGKSESAWRRAVKNFFRRSEYYCNFFEKKAPNADAAFQNYREAFQRRKIQITYLALMEFVYFAERSMDFGAFQVRQFSADELGAIFQNRVNEVFYPWAAVEVNQLQDYWFVCLIEHAPVPKLGWIDLDWDLSQADRVGIKYTGYPKAIETVLQQLALFDWQADWWKEPFAQGYKQQEKDLERGWLGFSIPPFVLKVHNNLLDFPRGAPDFSMLEREPFIDAQTGEEIGERPVVYIHLNKAETNSFKAFIQRTENFLASLRAKQYDWQFLEIALGNFIKAFFTGGLEQMLWHITVLEALLGEKGKGVTERLARRIASILGKSEGERKTLRKQFKELYSFRCDLVHGNPYQKQTYVGHLRNARNLARQTLLWFLHYLGTFQAGIPHYQPAESIPTREDILTLLDLDQNSRVRLSRLIDSLSSGFPYVREWIE